MVLWTLMNKTWPMEPDRCEVLNASDQDIMSQDVKAYVAKGWSRLANLYGCDTDGYFTRAALPWVYVLIKLKSFTLRVLKGRPISPHTRIPLKRVYNLIATAHAWALMQITTGRTGRLFTTAAYPRRLDEELPQLAADQNTNLRVVTRIGDLENMYVELGHGTIEDA